MNRFRKAALLLLFLTFSIKPESTPLSGRGGGSGSGFGARNFGGIIGVVAVSALIYTLYKWLNKEVPNDELSRNAQCMYDKIHETYGTIDFLYRPQKLGIDHDGQLFELANHKDIAEYIDQKTGKRRRNISAALGQK